MQDQKYFIEFIYSNSLKNKYSNFFKKLAENIAARGTDRKKVKNLYGYIESHHIIPKSFDPTHERNKFNILHCTAREHFFIHLLMTKMFNQSHKLYLNSHFAILKFFQIGKNQERHKLTSWEYEKLRKITVEVNKHIPRTGSTTNKKCYTNGIKNIFLNPNIDKIPEGFFKGSSTKNNILRITNGTENRSINSIEEIPEGWYVGSCTKGKESKLKGRKIGKYSEERKKVTREGVLKNGPTCFITDGITDKKIPCSSPIPDGWYRGRTNGVDNFKQKKTCPYCLRQFDIGNYVKHKEKCKEKLSTNLFDLFK